LVAAVELSAVNVTAEAYVAEAAFPVQDPEEPLVLPVTFPVTLPVSGPENAVAVIVPAAKLPDASRITTLLTVFMDAASEIFEEI
jgi:hypothetical protein